MSKVTVTPCGSYEAAEVRAALIRALEPLGGLSFVQPGMRIGLKANLVAPKSYHSGAVTHPVLLAELTRLIRERGGEIVIGDSPGGPFTAAYLRSVYLPAGLSLAEKAGAKLNLDTHLCTADFPAGAVLKQITYTGWLADCDAVITCAKLKTHAMLGMTGAVKNQFGIVPGLMKPEYHALYPKMQDFCNMLLDLNEFIKPRLALIDGVTGMEGNGPTAGTARQVGCLIASDSVYHADVAMAHIMGLTPGDMPLIHTAHQRGLGPETLDELTLCGDIAPFVKQDYRNLDIGGVSFGGREDSVLSQLVRGFLMRRPKVHPAACVGCGLCAKNCPAHAIHMDRAPKFDYTKCIRCFCCQEMCPREAISVKTTFLSRFLN